LKSYDFNEGKLFHLYKESEGKTHFSMAVFKDGDVNKLISSSYDSNVRIWNFNTGELLKTIKVYDDFIYGICLWNSKYLFVGALRAEVLLVNLDEGKVVKTINENNGLNLTLKKANIPDLEDLCLEQNRHRKGQSSSSPQRFLLLQLPARMQPVPYVYGDVTTILFCLTSLMILDVLLPSSLAI